MQCNAPRPSKREQLLHRTWHATFAPGEQCNEVQAQMLIRQRRYGWAHGFGCEMAEGRNEWMGGGWMCMQAGG